ncbi:MAG: FimV/HubP family polar landmark protein [Gammaproteobacteria bacterium]
MTFFQNLLNDIESTNLYILIVSITIATTLFLLIFAFSKTKKPAKASELKDSKPSTVITSHDIKAIAGEDVMSTQLDLARAYIEMDKKQLAKKILDHVCDHGDHLQMQEAKRLMAALELS